MGLLNRRRRAVIHTTQRNSIHTTVTKSNGDDTGNGHNHHRRRQWNTIVSSLRRTQMDLLPTQSTKNNDKNSNEASSTTIDLWTACKMGNTSLVRQIIKDHPELIHVEQQGRTPLYYACHSGHYKVVELLLKAGATDDALKTCHQSALNQKIRQLLQQYQTVDSVLEFQRTVMAMECPTPPCSSSSSSSSGCCDYDDNNENDMYLHLFDTIEATCSHSEDNNHNSQNNNNNNTETVKSNFNHCFPTEMESAPPPTNNGEESEIACSDSLLTERANNHSVIPISPPQSTTSAAAWSPQLLPSFMCCREASLIDSDAMEDRMWNSLNNSSNIDENEEETTCSNSKTIPFKKSTLTIETSEQKIEVQETMSHAKPECPNDSTTLKDRLFQRIALRRTKDCVATTGKNMDSETIVEGAAVQSSDALPLLRTRPRTIFGAARWNRNHIDEIVDDANVKKETIVTLANGESEIVLCANQKYCTIADTEPIDQNSTALIQHQIESLVAEDAIETPTFNDRTFNLSEGATTIDQSLTRATLLSPQPSTNSTNTGAMSLWSYDTFASIDDIKKVLIPITTVPVPFDNADDVVATTEGMHKDESSDKKATPPFEKQLPISDVSTVTTSPSICNKVDDKCAILESHKTKNKSKSIENDIVPAAVAGIYDKIPLQRTSYSVETTGQDIASPRTNFLESTLDLFGCFPDEVDDTFTLQSVSFDNQIHSAALDAKMLSESSNPKQMVSVNLKSNGDRNLTSRVDKLIHETSLLHSLKSITSEISDHASLVEVHAMVTTPSPLSSMSMSTYSNLDENALTDQEDDDYCPELDNEAINQSYGGDDTGSDDDNEGVDDATNTSRSGVDHLLEGNDTDHYSIFSSTSSSESFYDDYDNTLDQLMNHDDEISGPEITMIFCR